MGADDREIHIENFDPMSIYGELAVRTDEAPDPNGVSVETMFDFDGLYVTLRDKYGSSRSVRLVVAPDEPVASPPEAVTESHPATNPAVSLGNWFRR